MNAEPPASPQPATSERERLIKEREALLGEAKQHEQASALEDAIALASEVLALDRQLHGDAHPSVVLSLVYLSELYRKSGDADAAANAQQEAEATKKRLPANPRASTTAPTTKQPAAPELTPEQQAHLAEAKAFNSQVVKLLNQGKFREALPIANRALRIRKGVLGERHPDYATSLNNLAGLYDSMGDYARAEPLLVEALKIRKEVLGERHPDCATCLGNLAGLYLDMGDYARAEPLYIEALKIRKEVLGERHPSYATSLNNLATLYEDMGNYARAEPLYVEVRTICKELLGDRHSICATILNNLAGLYRRMGDYSRAEPLFVEALKIRKEFLGERHPDYATSLNNLAGLYDSMGDYARAEPLLVEALKINKEVLGERHPSYATSLNNLAGLYERMGDYARAEPLLVEALKINKEVLGDRHSLCATILNNLADLYQRMGDYARAEPQFVEALKISKEFLGERHPHYATSLHNLAGLYYSMGDYARAGPLLLQAVDLSLEHWELTATVQSERQQRAMGNSLRYFLDNLLSITASTRADITLQYAAVLRWKGAVLARQRSGRVLRASGDPSVRKLGEQLQGTAGRLATLALATPTPAQQATWRKQVDELTAEKEQLEARLSAASAEYRQSQAQQRLTPADLQHALPEDAVLIDLLEYWHSTPPAEKKGPFNHERRLAAFVMRRDMPVALVDLGAAETIAAHVDTWRKSLGESGEAQSAAAALRKQVWEPLVPHIGSTQTVLVSPDGALTRFPLAVLPGSKPGSYLLEEKALVIVPVPQLLPTALPPNSEHSTCNSLLVIGDVDFDANSPAAQPAAIAPPDLLAATHRSAPRDGGVFAPLPGAAIEAEAIEKLFTQSFAGGATRLLRKAAASEEEFRTSAPQYRYLHLATHGYFAPPKLHSALAADRTPNEFEARLDGARETAGFNPGLLSGIALAGANRPPESSRDDGILTALEAAELPLEGVELVTLSACETGLGATAGGEGTLGLQRAFQAAGARNVVSSLWKVPDQATRSLMTRFYENLWQKKLPKLAALREAQIWMLREGVKQPELWRGQGELVPIDISTAQNASAAPGLPPRYWAAFMLSGDWR